MRTTVGIIGLDVLRLGVAVAAARILLSVHRTRIDSAIAGIALHGIRRDELLAAGELGVFVAPVLDVLEAVQCELFTRLEVADAIVALQRILPLLGDAATNRGAADGTRQERGHLLHPDIHIHLLRDLRSGYPDPEISE